MVRCPQWQRFPDAGAIQNSAMKGIVWETVDMALGGKQHTGKYFRLSLWYAMIPGLRWPIFK